ncbi:MAG: amidase [Alphaproteobacteria bacterium]|nr:amidase [Alphaproteobacteria bacterium]
MTSTDPSLMSAEDLLAAYHRRALSPVEAITAVFARIGRLNPRLNAFAVLDEAGAMEAARASEARWRAGRPLGLLDGVPTTVKDLMNLRGFPTRRGSKASDPAPASEDAPAVTGLKAEGAIIIGKTTTTEFGWKTPSDCPLHGTTGNPWHASVTAGGSSAGAGAAAAAGLGALHTGTDAGGSIRIPASFCGLVGLKPTFGRVPQWPTSAFANVSHAGPITRTVRDAALMLSAMARYDARDPYCLPDQPTDWRGAIEDGIAGLRVAFTARLGFDLDIDPEVRALFARAVARFADALGCVVEEAAPVIPDGRQVFTRMWAGGLAKLVASLGPERAALLDPGLRRVAAEAQGMTAIELMTAEAMRLETGHALNLFHQRFDLLLTPTVPVPPFPIDREFPDPAKALWTEWAPLTFTFNLSRGPAVTVPCGRTAAGLPIGLQIAAPIYRDELVLRAARAFERVAPWPTVAPH